MKTNIYLSYDDAVEAVAGDKSVTVKATSLDQVMYVRLLHAHTVFFCFTKA
jgi:hypothetical protein